jgi:hypothetical protein
MGAKTGYADAILRILGFRPGQGAARYLWCEPDPGVRLLLEAYRDADLARAAAAIIRGWADEEPRALWERLRAEGPPRGVDPGDVGVLPREVARWMTIGQWSYRRMEPDSGWCSVRVPRGDEPIIEGDRKPARNIAADFEALAMLPATITPDARRVDPREVARWVWTWGRSYNTKGPDAGFLPSESSKGTPVWNAHPPEHFADAMGDLPALPATITPDARGIEPGPDLPAGTVAYMDPPYVGTTGYGHDLPRSEVVALARRWAAAGATVAISEAEPIADLTAEGWHAVRVDGERRGQKRTFSKQQAEWLTLSRPPAWTPPEQRGLFS